MNAWAARETSEVWRAAREKAGGYALLRVIDLREQKQSFQLLRPRNANDMSDLAWDGYTFIVTDCPLSPQERLAIVKRFDELYLARNGAAG